LREENLSKEEKKRRFYERLRKGTQDIEDVYAQCSYYIEKELHQIVTPEYPASKFHVQLEEMKKDYERQERQMKSGKAGRPTNTFG